MFRAAFKLNLSALVAATVGASVATVVAREDFAPVLNAPLSECTGGASRSILLMVARSRVCLAAASSSRFRATISSRNAIEKSVG